MSSPWYHNPPESATIPVMKTQQSHVLIVVTVAPLGRDLYSVVGVLVAVARLAGHGSEDPWLMEVLATAEQWAAAEER